MAHLALLLAQGRRDGLLFPGRRGRPVSDRALLTSARAAWKAAGLEALTLHDCRHTFASICIAAGINAKALSTFLGHSSIQTTFNIYGHLMPGAEDKAADLLDAHLGEGPVQAKGAPT